MELCQTKVILKAEKSNKLMEYPKKKLRGKKGVSESLCSSRWECCKWTPDREVACPTALFRIRYQRHTFIESASHSKCKCWSETGRQGAWRHRQPSRCRLESFKNGKNKMENIWKYIYYQKLISLQQVLPKKSFQNCCKEKLRYFIMAIDPARSDYHFFSLCQLRLIIKKNSRGKGETLRKTRKF